MGYGDYCPKTPIGMVFGGMCTVASVLMIDLPMPIIVENFANYYNHLQARSKFPKKLRRKVLGVETPRSRSRLNRGSTQQPINTAATIALMTTKFGANIALLKNDPTTTTTSTSISKRFNDD